MKILVTGAAGKLGSELASTLKGVGVHVVKATRKDADITDYNEVWNIVKTFTSIPSKYMFCINCAAMIGLPNCEDNKQKAYDTNVIGAMNVADVCGRNGVKPIHISTDYAYNGFTPFHTEREAVCPTSYYALTKILGEPYVLSNHGFVLRTSFFPKEITWEAAYVDKFTSGDYVDVIAAKIAKMFTDDVITKREMKYGGIYNVGTQRKSFHELAKERKPDINKAFAPEGTPLDTSMLCTKFNTLIGEE